MIKTQRIIVIGGGFGGVKAALNLANDERLSVTLISSSDDLQYYPMLYRTATGGSQADSSIALDDIFGHSSVKVVKDIAVKLDRKNKKVLTGNGDLYSYDQLIIAIGVVTNYFGIKGLADYSYGIKSQAEVKKFKDHLHKQLIDDGRPDLNYVVVGAGPTGIELAGALPFYIKKIMKNHNLPDKKINIDLVEALPRLLPNLPRLVSRKVHKRLKSLGINLYLNSKVEGETADNLIVNGRPINTHTVIWTAGVTNNPFFKNNQFALMGNGKVAVNVYLQAEPNIFVIGDNANTPFSGMAQTAVYDGEFVAENIKRKLEHKDYKSYVAKRPISIIPAGPNWSVVIWGKLSFDGLIGHLLRQAADIKGLHELEPWSKTIKQYLNDFTISEDCTLCAVNINSSDRKF